MVKSVEPAIGSAPCDASTPARSRWRLLALQLAALLWIGFALVVLGGVLATVALGWIQGLGPLVAVVFWAWAGWIFLAVGRRTLSLRVPGGPGLAWQRLRWDAVGSIGFALVLIGFDWLHYELEWRATVDESLHLALGVPLLAGLLAVLACLEPAHRRAGSIPAEPPA